MATANRLIGVIVGSAVLIGTSCLVAQDWPQWRGGDRDGKVAGFTVPQTWPQTLTQKWKVSVGSGDATPALVGDKLYEELARIKVAEGSTYAFPVIAGNRIYVKDQDSLALLVIE